MLGKALKDLPRDKIFVTSKCGRYDEAEFDFSPDRVRKSVKESLQRLQLDYLDLVHCHDIEFVNIDQVMGMIFPKHIPLRHVKSQRHKARVCMQILVQCLSHLHVKQMCSA